MDEQSHLNNRESGQFESWARDLAGELAAAALMAEAADARDPVRFLVSELALGGPEAERIPGFVCGGEEAKNGADLIHFVYQRAWEDLDGTDCRLRVYSGYEPEMGDGYVLGLDLTDRPACPSGSVLFLVDPLDLEALVCNTEQDLVELWRAASRGVAPATQSRGA